MSEKKINQSNKCTQTMFSWFVLFSLGPCYSRCSTQSALFYLVFYFCFKFSTSLIPAGKSGRLTWVRLQQPQEQRYPFLTMPAVFSCVQAKVWLPVLGSFNVHTDVNACDCTRGLYGHRKRVGTKSWLVEKSLGAPGNRTCLSGVPVRRSTD